MSLLGSEAQKGVLSGVERRRESRGERDCLTLSERSKKSSGEKNKIKEAQTQICTRKCCLSSPKIKSKGVAVKKKYLLDIESNKGFLLCKD